MARPTVLAFAIALALAGCKDKELPAGKLTPEVRGLLAQVPGDSKVVAGIDLALARKSGLWDKGLAEAMPIVLALGHQCGTNLMTEVDRVIASSPDQQPDSKRVHVVVVGRFTASGKSCLDEIATLREAKVSWIDGGTAVVAPAAAATAAAPLTASPAMMGWIEKADTSGIGWLAADTRSTGAARVPMPPELLGLALSILPRGDGVRAIARLQLDSEDRAKSTAEMFRDQKDSFKKAIPDPKLGELIGRLEVTQTGAELGFQIALDRAEIDHLLGLKAMLGGR